MPHCWNHFNEHGFRRLHRLHHPTKSGYAPDQVTHCFITAKRNRKKKKKGFVTQGTDTALAHFQIAPNFPAVKFNPLPKFRGKRRSTFYFLNLDHSGRQWKQNVLYMYTSEQFFCFVLLFAQFLIMIQLTLNTNFTKGFLG